MAKILMTAIVADIRNKLNGSVFSKNRYGAYVRTKVTPVNPQTAAQQAVRNQLATNSQAWRGLTQSQRNGWIAAAASFPQTDIFGNTKILSGNALYVKFNNNLMIAGIAPISDAPSPVSIPTLTLGSLDADASAHTVVVTFTETPVPADTAMIIYATPQIGPGISFVKNRYRFLTRLDAGEASPGGFGSTYEGLHGTLVAGQQIFINAFLISTVTGQAGIPVSISTFIVP